MLLLYEDAARYFEEGNAHTRCEFSDYNEFCEYKSPRRVNLDSLVRRNVIARKLSSRQRTAEAMNGNSSFRNSHKFQFPLSVQRTKDPTNVGLGFLWRRTTGMH